MTKALSVRPGGRTCNTLIAMGTNFTGTDGMVCDRNVGYYRERARGGVGLIIVEAVYIHQSGKHRINGIGATGDRFIPGLRRRSRSHVLGSQPLSGATALIPPPVSGDPCHREEREAMGANSSVSVIILSRLTRIPAAQKVSSVGSRPNG